MCFPRGLSDSKERHFTHGGKVVLDSVILERWREKMRSSYVKKIPLLYEDHELEANLGYIIKLCLKKMREGEADRQRQRFGMGWSFFVRWPGQMYNKNTSVSLTV